MSMANKQTPVIAHPDAINFPNALFGTTSP
jgi:hypothetical protein